MAIIKEITMEKNLNYHCILCVRSNEVPPLVQAMLPRRVQRLKITDRDSPEEKAATERKRRLGFSLPPPPFRYFGVLSSSGQVKGPDILRHVEWLFSNFRPEFDLTEWKSIGAEYELSFAWWGGLGTAYGPSIAPELADILARHRVTLGISVY